SAAAPDAQPAADGEAADPDADDADTHDADGAAAGGESDEPEPDEHDADEHERRRVHEPGPGAGSGRRPPRPRVVVGGPDDGSGSGSGGRMRRFGLGFVALAILVVIILLGVGVTFLTDAIWFRSVGYESVFGTRVTTQIGLFAGGGIVALLFLLFNVWLAGRLLPPPDPDRASPFAGWFERIAGAAESGGSWSRQGRPWEGRPPMRPGGNRMGPRPIEGISLSADDLPDFAPIARWSLIALVVLIALGVGGSAGRPLGA